MSSVSVAMAVYNGEKYIREQIDSILVQLKSEDELIISYNPSNDNTYQIIKQYEENNDRVMVYECLEMGVLKNFENAIKHCSNEIIFLADQDDVWFDNKVKTICDYFDDENVSAVVHDVINVDKDLNVIKSVEKKRTICHDIKRYEIFIKNRVQGSCLAVRKEYIKRALPFPKHIPMHDSWIGLITATYGKVIYIGIPLMLYRRHENSVSPDVHRSVLWMLKDRLNLFVNYSKRVLELYKLKTH